MPHAKVDYIVVGAGSAGSVIASRLVSQEKGSVLLLEAGPPDSNPLIHIPGALSLVIPRKTWPYVTEPDPATLNRSMSIAQGRVLGGSSSVNGMIYIRGQQQDYDRWEHEFGATGWGAQDMLYYFRKAENNESLADDYHGTTGLLPVSENRYRHPLSQAFIQAGQQFGLPYINDFNAANQAGVGFFQLTVRNGARASTAQTYLKAVKNSKILQIQTGALVEKIELQQGRATGITYSVKHRRKTVEANKEVIICAGAIGSAKLLQLSGIGPSEVLKSAEVRQKLELPVGRYLQDHTHMSLNATTDSSSLYGQDKGLKAIKNGIQWLGFRSGLLTSNILEATAFYDTCGQGRPDTQIHFLPVLDSWDDPDGIGKGYTHGLTLKVGNVQPTARGCVEIHSPDPMTLPKIKANYLGTDEDVQGAIRAVKLGLSILDMPALSDRIHDIFSPNTLQRGNDESLETFVRGNCKTVYHPVGTCRIGTDPATSVVDPHLHVHGIEGLRVADSSVFPAIPSGNTNAPTIAVAEKAADLIMGNTHQSIITGEHHARGTFA